VQVQLLLRDEAAEAAEWRKLDINGNGNVRSTTVFARVRVRVFKLSCDRAHCRSARASC
jgi:hypothetical protein